MGAQVKWRKDREAWFLYVYANGTQTAKRYGATLADKRRAERQAKEVNRELTRRRLGLQRKEKKVPFAEFASQWVQDKVLLPTERGLTDAVAPKTAKMHEQMLRLHLAPFLKDIDIRSIDSGTVDELEAHFIRAGRPPSRRSIQIALGTLRQIMAWAVAKKLIEVNPVVAWKSALQSRGRKQGGSRSKRVADLKVLDFDEREDFLAAFEREAPHYFPFVLYLAETGCRISEAMTLTWADIDFARTEARVLRHKTGGEPDHVELSPRILDCLKAVRPDICPPGHLVFRTPGGSPIRYENFLHRVWDPVVLEVFGLDRRVTPHTLRHTWASLHLARGTPIEWVRRMGGWSSAKMLLDVYGHYIPREMRGFSSALAPSDRTRPNQLARDSA